MDADANHLFAVVPSLPNLVVTQGRLAVCSPTNTITLPRFFILSLIHRVMAPSPSFLTASQSLLDIGVLPSTTPILRTWPARQWS